MGQYGRKIVGVRMMVGRIALISLCLLLAACAPRHQQYYCEPQVYTLQMVEARYGTPNQVISRHSYTWFGYVTKSPADYPVKNNFSALYPRTPIAKPVPVTYLHPRPSSAFRGCAVWYKSNRRGIIIDVRRYGEYCTAADWHRGIGV
jgi:hypothetical protein